MRQLHLMSSFGKRMRFEKLYQQSENARDKERCLTIHILNWLTAIPPTKEMTILIFAKIVKCLWNTHDTVGICEFGFVVWIVRYCSDRVCIHIIYIFTKDQVAMSIWVLMEWQEIAYCAKSHRSCNCETRYWYFNHGHVCITISKP